MDHKFGYGQVELACDTVQWSQGLSGLSLERAWLLEVAVTPGQ